MSGRVLPGRFSLALPAGWEVTAAALGLAALTVVSRLPFRSRYLANWDAVQFAMGMRHFDLAHHQPHPPGYVGYIALGRLVLLVLPDANSALVAVSVTAEAAAVTVGFLFARSLFGTFAGVVTAGALLTAPLFWYYGEVANTYGVEPLLVLLVAWPLWRAWAGQPVFAYPAALALGLAGAIRPSTMVFLIPVFAVALYRLRSHSTAAQALLLFALTAATWIVPLVVLAHGPANLLAVSLQLGGSVTAGTAIWNDLGNLRVTGGAVLTGVAWELGFFSVIAFFGLAVAPRLTGRPAVPRSWTLFCWLWSAPALATFLLIHIGQLAYVQVFAPALFLSLGPAVAATAGALGRPQLARPLAGVAMALSTVIFLLPPRYSLAEQLRLHDLHVAGLVMAASAAQPASSVLVTDAYAVGSYRTAGYYLPGYRRLAIQFDRQGRLREIYGDAYDPAGGTHSLPLEPIPGVTTYLFLDAETVDLFGNPDQLTPLPMPDGSYLYRWDGRLPRVLGNQLWAGHPASRLAASAR